MEIKKSVVKLVGKKETTKQDGIRKQLKVKAIIIERRAKTCTVYQVYSQLLMKEKIPNILLFLSIFSSYLVSKIGIKAITIPIKKGQTLETQNPNPNNINCHQEFTGISSVRFSCIFK